MNLFSHFSLLEVESESKSNLVVVIVFSPQNFVMAPAEYTTSSVSFILFQWGNLSLLELKRKGYPLMDWWPVGGKGIVSLTQ